MLSSAEGMGTPGFSVQEQVPYVPEAYNYLDEIAFHFKGVAGGKAELVSLQSNADPGENHTQEGSLQSQPFEKVASEDGIYALSARFTPGDEDQLLLTVTVNGQAVVEDFVMQDGYSALKGPRYGWMFQCIPANGVKVTLPEVQTLAGDYTAQVPDVDLSKPVEDVTVGVAFDETVGQMMKESVDEALQEKIDGAVAQGQDVVVTTEITGIDAANVPQELAEDVSAAKEAAQAGKLQVADFFDLSVLVKSGTDVLGEITQTNAPVTFQIAIPEALKAEGRTFSVIRVHQGQTTVLETVEANGLLTFQTDKFSVYALAYSDAAGTQPDTGKEEPNTGSPETGDSMNLVLWLVVLGVSLVGIITLAVVLIRKPYRPKH